MMPTAQVLRAAMEATWPPVRAWRQGAFLLREGQGGGSRVSAATLEEAEPEGLSEGSPDGLEDGLEDGLARAEAAMRGLGQAALFQLRPGQEAFDALLGARGYAVKDPVVFYAMPCAPMAAPACEVYELWPPIAALREVWAEGGIDPARLAVMARAPGAKVALMGRAGDMPASAAFVAAHGPGAMLHALDVLPPARRRGLGRLMMLQASDWAARQGCAWLGLAVTEANAQANALYRGLGMQAISRYHYRIAGETA